MHGLLTRHGLGAGCLQSWGAATCAAPEPGRQGGRQGGRTSSPSPTLFSARASFPARSR